ncbi:MAG TPA: Gfo/Idh/MocA family oxidoreductase [Trebonia sp.]|nr:Gfo/Idh/MocA family oxidoreductase [Trebonia sp.]
MIRIAFAGTGNIARVHARALAGPLADGTAALVAATDADAGTLASFAAEVGLRRTYPNLADLLEREQVDLVHLCTPPGTHHQLALACLRAGTSVLVEKPPAISLREFDEIATGGGPPWFATVFQHRFGQGQLRLKALTTQSAGQSGHGPLGRPLLAICHTTWFRDQAYFDVPWRGRWETEGGGPTMGHGIHQMDMLADVLGDWTEVSAIMRTQARRMPTEDLSLAHVTFSSGAVASIVNSVLSPREQSYLRFDFEHATVEVSHLYGYADDDWRVTPAEGHKEVLDAWKQAVPAAGEDTDGRSGHGGQFRAVLAALAVGQPPPVAPDDARRTLSLVAAIYASAFTGRPVTPRDLAAGTPFYASMNGRQATP